MKIPRKTADAIVLFWQQDRKLFDVLVHIAGLSPDVPVADWDELRLMSGIPMDITHYVKMPIRAWVSNYFVNASNELWSNHPNRALRWLLSGKDTSAHSRPMQQAAGEFKKAAGYKVIRAREQDKRHDWNTCK